MRIQEIMINPTLQFGNVFVKYYVRMTLRNRIIFWLAKMVLSLANTKGASECIYKLETGVAK